MKQGLGLALLLASSTACMAESSLDVKRQQELTYMLKHDCGSCHGMTLKGGLGPSLLPNTLSSKGHNIESLSLIIRYGKPGTAMPPWGPVLAEEDIRWIATQLLETN
ncbi:hypothetical protein BGP75_09855 [Motiliproteus sp. MSK22-1]|nr:hypothetical protein BGP75_09855 [Motiliproteus sp. MSK22-1]